MSQIAIERHHFVGARVEESVRSSARYMVPVGRALFAAMFIAAGFSHLSRPVIAYAAAQGVPFASVLVPASGILALLGGLSILLGYHARIGAGLIVLFLVPVTLGMHQFWAVHDAMRAQIEQAMFMKNAAMIGGALVLAYFGAGPFSVDARRGAAGSTA